MSAPTCRERTVSPKTSPITSWISQPGMSFMVVMSTCASWFASLRAAERTHRAGTAVVPRTCGRLGAKSLQIGARHATVSSIAFVLGRSRPHWGTRPRERATARGRTRSARRPRRAAGLERRERHRVGEGLRAGPGEERRRSSPPTSFGATKRSSLSTSPAREEGAGERRARPRGAATGRPRRRAGAAPRRAAPRAARAPTPPAAGRGRTRAGAAGAPRRRRGRSSAGSSARTVPIPTATASDAARSSWTRRRLSSPETQRASPPAAASRPSSVIAAL